MARSSECTDEYARKVLDTADIVIALGKAWKRGNRDETVKLLMESSGCKSRPVTVEQTDRKRVLPFTGRLVDAKRTQQGSRP
jgi:hypothetical protein